MTDFIFWASVFAMALTEINGICLVIFCIRREAHGAGERGFGRAARSRWSRVLRAYWDEPGGRILCCVHSAAFVTMLVSHCAYWLHEVLTNPYL